MYYTKCYYTKMYYTKCYWSLNSFPDFTEVHGNSICGGSMRGGGTMRWTGQGRKSIRRRNRRYGHTHIRLKYSAPSFNLQVVSMVVKEYFDVVFCRSIFSCFFFSKLTHFGSFIFLIFIIRPHSTVHSSCVKFCGNCGNSFKKSVKLQIRLALSHLTLLIVPD